VHLFGLIIRIIQTEFQYGWVRWWGGFEKSVLHIQPVTPDTYNKAGKQGQKLISAPEQIMALPAPHHIDEIHNH